MKSKELREKSKEELKELLAAERAKIFEIRMKSSESRPKNVKEAGEAKKNIARILTLLKQ